MLVGDVTGAAAVLSKSPGLGWSNPDHPGHTLFPLLAMLLSNGTIGDALVTELEATGRDPLESFAMTDEEHKPKLSTPSMVALIQSVRPGIALTDPDRDAAIDAMRIAAEKRTEGILGNSRRQHYGHAALLVASCVAFAPKSRAAELLRWATDLRQQVPGVATRSERSWRERVRVWVCWCQPELGVARDSIGFLLLA